MTTAGEGAGKVCEVVSLEVHLVRKSGKSERGGSGFGATRGKKRAGPCRAALGFGQFSNLPGAPRRSLGYGLRPPLGMTCQVVPAYTRDGIVNDMRDGDDIFAGGKNISKFAGASGFGYGQSAVKRAGWDCIQTLRARQCCETVRGGIVSVTTAGE